MPQKSLKLPQNLVKFIEMPQKRQQTDTKFS